MTHSLPEGIPAVWMIGHRFLVFKLPSIQPLSISDISSLTASLQRKEHHNSSQELAKVVVRYRIKPHPGGQDSFLWYHPVCSVVHDCLLQLTWLLPLCPPLLCQHQNSVSGPAWALKLPSKKCRQCQILQSKRMTRVRVHKDNTCKAG
jgi:hypothetical protein